MTDRRPPPRRGFGRPPGSDAGGEDKAPPRMPRNPGAPDGPNRPRATRRTDDAARDGRLYGLHAGLAAIANPARKVRRIVATETTAEAVAKAIAEAEAAGASRPAPKIAPRSYLDSLLPPSAVHQGVLLDADPLKSPTLERFLDTLPTDRPTVLVALDQVTDPHNVGAILRSAAAFGAAGMILTNRHAPTATGVVAKSASGALEVVPLVRVGNLNAALDTVRAAGFRSLALAEQADTPLDAAPLADSDRWILLLGAEGEGLRASVLAGADCTVRLPTRPPIESLNVSTAAAVALYALSAARPTG